MAKEDSRRSRDAAGVGPYARERERLVPLSKMGGWNVMDGEPDIRSWDVTTVSGKMLGRVEELLVDLKAGEVVMLDVDLVGTDRRAYVPIRVVEIDRTRRVVRADSGDLEEHEQSADRTRLTPAELARVGRDIRYASATGERVVERRPVVEETVVRRRTADDTEKRL
jgi:sporulation protein YlmC with PRC-barrel domain